MLEVLNLAKYYGHRKIIKDVSFSVKRGEVFGILGPNGAGKTTCFYMIFGIVKPDSGTIKLNNNDITHIPIYLRSKIGIGYLPQEQSIFQGLTTEENIMSVLQNFISDTAERISKLDELINEFKLEHVRKSLAISLSGGERRRLEIARLLASNPSFVLLDEPFAGVDPISVSGVVDVINTLAKRNIGVIITDHSAKEILNVADTVCVIYDGKVLVQGNKNDILSNEVVKKVYLGNSFEI